MLIDFLEGTKFHQLWILQQQPGWFLPHALIGLCLWCAGRLLLFYQWWYLSAGLLVMSYKKNEPRRWEVTPFLGRDSHDETAWCIFNIYQFFSLLHQGACYEILLLHSYEWFWILFRFCIWRAIIVTRRASFFPTFIAGDVVKVSSGFLILVFCFIFIIPSFTTLRKHKLIADAVGLGLPIIIMARMEI